VNINTVFENVRQVSADFARDRQERQMRRHLEPADFDRLAQAGFLLTGVPASHGGLWEDMQHSLRPVCDIVRVLAQGDPSVALVAAMHPAVVYAVGWLTLDQAPQPYEKAWGTQRRWVFETVRNGAWWGTIVSEPGTGGAVQNTRATARLEDPPLGYRISGSKHFGSGSGLSSYMITTAIPEGETEPDHFFMDLRNVPVDGSAGVALVGAWDGHGMTATQSHSMRFDDYPGTRAAWPGRNNRRDGTQAVAGSCLFTAVIVGIVEVAIDTARRQLERRRASLGAFERVEWTRAEIEGWLVQQAYRGMLRDAANGPRRGPLLGKTAIAELASSMLDRLCKIMGGGAYARRSPFGFWLQDVRALGYLRPPWPLAFDMMFDEIPNEPTAEINAIAPDGFGVQPVVQASRGGIPSA
jgi:alkylation response protein AidB-like acyl-CoA dehydrogenase